MAFFHLRLLSLPVVSRTIQDPIELNFLYRCLTNQISLLYLIKSTYFTLWKKFNQNCPLTTMKTGCLENGSTFLGDVKITIYSNKGQSTNLTRPGNRKSTAPRIFHVNKLLVYSYWQFELRAS